jgi:multidrug transporter EmrE-like cation transporter
MIIALSIALCAVLLTGVSQTLLKVGTNSGVRSNRFLDYYLNLPTMMAYGLFLLVTVFTVYALRDLPLKVFYSLTALNFIVVLGLSVVFLNEEVSRDKMVAISLIALGVVVFNLS